MTKRTAPPDPVSEAFRRVLEDLRRDRAIEPSQMITLRDLIVAILLAAAISCAGIAWVHSDWLSPWDQQTDQ